MKLYANFLALSCVAVATSGFVVQTPACRSSTSLAMSDYLGQLRRTGGPQTNTVGPSPPPPGQQINPGKETERDLERRLNKLTETERNLQSRLASLSRKEKEVNQRLSSIGGSDPYTQSRDNSSWRQSPYGAQSIRSNTMRPSAFDRNTERMANRPAGQMMSIDEIFEMNEPTTVQGGSLRTWSFANPAIEMVHLVMKTDGRPLEADIQLWHGPDNTPHKMKVYVEDGAKRTFSTFIGTPRGPNTIAVRNVAPVEFPMYAVIGPDQGAGRDCFEATKYSKGEVIQGGALRTYPFDYGVDSVAVLIKTDGRPLNARIELLQGPNNNKQVLDLYTEDGLDRPFLAIIQTPGSGNVVRIVNQAPVEFPMHATVVEYEKNNGDYSMDGVQMWNMQQF